MRILDQMPVPILPVYLDEFWGSIFTYSEGKSLRKFPKSFRHPLSLHVGKPVWRPQTIYEVRQAVVELGAQAAKHRRGHFQGPVNRFIR
nr:hypothetical protein [Burkholderiales bacterium]